MDLRKELDEELGGHLDKKQGFAFSELDPRMKLLLVLVFTTATFMSPNTFVLAWNYALILLLYAARGLWGGLWKTGLLFGGLLLCEFSITLIAHEGTRATLGLIVFLLERTAVFFVMGAWMATKLRVGDFVTAMQNMRLPKGVTITLAVVFRYLPTVKEEFRYIKNTMTLRGIGLNAKNILLRPLKTCEYAIVPLIIRSMTISDQLAASAMTRGLDLKTKRTSYREVRLRIGDVLCTAAVICAVAAGLALNFLLQNGALP
jgi:energy-coupling factor transporter transmembrane protein EcfT